MNSLVWLLLLIGFSFKGTAQNPSLDTLINQIHTLSKQSRSLQFDTLIIEKLSLLSDNGVGIAEKVSEHGMGLTNIKTRVVSLQDKVDFVSVPDKGTEVKIEVPIG